MSNETKIKMTSEISKKQIQKSYLPQPTHLSLSLSS